MGTYRIHPAGVQTVLTATIKDAEHLAAAVKPLSGSVEDAATCTGLSGAIVPALTEFFTAQEKRLSGIGTRIDACVTGAADATKSYNRHDYEMFQTYQANAVKVAHRAPH